MRKVLISTPIMLLLAGAASAGTVGVDSQTNSTTGATTGTTVERQAGMDYKSGKQSSDTQGGKQQPAMNRGGSDMKQQGKDLSRAVGTTAVDSAGEEIGQVTNVVKGKNGTTEAVVLKTSGILFGVGAQEVKVPADRVSMDGNRTVIAMTESEIEELPDLQG